MTRDKVTYIFDTLKRSKVSITALSQLTRSTKKDLPFGINPEQASISAASLFAWRKGDRITDTFKLNMVYGFAVRLDKAVEMGLLPLGKEFAIGKCYAADRLRKLREIIACANEEMRRSDSA